MAFFNGVLVENFRSIERADLPLGPITVVVGRNNAGKSSLLRSIYAVQQFQRPDDIRHGQDRFSVTLRSDGLPNVTMNGDRLPEGYAGPASISFSTQRSQPGQMRLAMTVTVDEGRLEVGYDRPPEAQPRNLFYPVFGARRGTNLGDQQVTASAARQVQESESNLVSRVAQFAAGNTPQAREFRRLCVDVLDLEIDTLIREHGQALGQRLGFEFDVPLGAMGAGIAALVGLLLDLAVARNQVILIEEPENDLHPRALKALLDAIQASSQRNQFIISTHSNIVLTRLAGSEGAVVLRAERVDVAAPDGERLPTTRFEVVESATERVKLLRELGYELADYDLAEGWLLIEEASAESIIKLLISWFVPGLAGLKTVSTGGTGRVEQVFRNLGEMFLYVHLEPQYRGRAWVLVDGDPSGADVVERLKRAFPTWDSSHFHHWRHAQIEAYLPTPFDARVAALTEIVGKQELRSEKSALLKDVLAWVAEDSDRARAGFADSAAELVDKLVEIESALRTQAPARPVAGLPQQSRA